jgi:hypothetical protein
MAIGKAARPVSGGKSPSPSINYSPATSADNSAIEQSKDQPPATASPAAGAAQSTLDVRITGANVAAGNVHVGTLVSGTASGSCTLTAAKAGQQALQLGSSSVKSNVNEYDCGVFNVPTASFPASGTWTLSLQVTNGTGEGSGTYDVTIP